MRKKKLKTTKTVLKSEQNIHKLNAQQWLTNIFNCENENLYCFYLDKEKQVCTKRFYEFMTDSEEIFGASNLTGNEYNTTVKRYKEKWASIYMLRNEKYGETWLFGRGQDDMMNIEKVVITKILNLKYIVYIDFGNNIITQSEVTLVLENNDFKIDYCTTQFLEDAVSINSEIVFPKTGNTAIDFLPESNIYEIQYEAKGDLNNDNQLDIAVVLKSNEDNTAQRPTLILLQNQDKSYRLDKVSNFVFQAEYSDGEYKSYDTEDISIENTILNIKLYSSGPSGNIFSDFKYFGNDLILTNIETYNAGAGSWQQLYYDLLKGELSQEVTNTMDENMPTKNKKYKLSKIKYKFETSSPNDIVIESYKKTDSNF